MELSRAADYFASRWRWRTRPEWYKELRGSLMDRVIQQRSKASGTPADATTPETTVETPAPSRHDQTRDQMEQETIAAYLQEVAEALGTIDHDDAKALHKRSLDLLGAKVSPKQLLDFGKSLDALKKANPAVAKAVNAKQKEAKGSSSKSTWERVEGELEQLREQEKQGKDLEFSKNLAGTSLGLVDALLGPAGPLFKAVRDVYDEHKDSAKELMAKFESVRVHLRDRARAFRRSWGTRNALFQRLFPKLSSQLDKLVNAAKSSGQSIIGMLKNKAGAFAKAGAIGAAAIGAGALAGSMMPDVGLTVESIAQRIRDALTKAFKLWTDLTDWVSKTWDGAIDSAKSAWSSAVAAFDAAMDSVKEAKEWIETNAKELWDSICGWVSDVWTRIKNLIPDGAKAAVEGVKSAASSMMNKAQTLIDRFTGKQPDKTDGNKAASAQTVVAQPTTQPTTQPPKTKTAASAIAPALAAAQDPPSTAGDGTATPQTVVQSGAKNFASLGQKSVRVAGNVDLGSMNKGLMQSFYSMVGEYNQITGKQVSVNSGARSSEQQAQLHKQNPSKAAPPGFSMHEFGLALDINSAEANEMERLGLFKKYGFTRPVRGEPWHLEPVAIQRFKDSIRAGTVKSDVDVPQTGDSEGMGTTQVAQKASGPKKTKGSDDGESTATRSMANAVLPSSMRTDAATTSAMLPSEKAEVAIGATTPKPEYVPIKAAPDTFERVESTSRVINTEVAAPVTPPAVTMGNTGSTQVSMNKIGFYVGDMGMLTTNLGIGG